MAILGAKQLHTDKGVLFQLFTVLLYIFPLQYLKIEL